MTPRTYDYSSAFAAKVRAAREESGMSLKEAADELGIYKAALWHIENGRRSASWDLIQRIARLYRMDAEELRLLTGMPNEEETTYLRRTPKAHKLVNALMRAKVGEAVIDELIAAVGKRKRR